MSPTLQSLADSFLLGSISRREFLAKFFRISAAAGMASVTLSSALGCVTSVRNVQLELDQQQDAQLKAVLSTLFPSEEDSPGADELGAVSYFHLVLLDPGVPAERKKLIVNGLSWLDEECRASYRLTFAELGERERGRAIERLVKKEWGERWCSALLTYLFEALLADPIYGGNPNGIGWKWLEHTPGAPRPQQHNRYPKMLA